MNIRAKAVEMAREQGLCTQCLKNKVAEHRYQCQRCIDTNHRKQVERSLLMNPEMKELRKTNPTEYEKLKKRKQRAKKYGGGITGRKLSPEHIENIRRGLALASARKKALGNQDTEFLARRKYTKRTPIASIQMAGAVNDLERFIGNLSTMSASDYLEAREDLIRSIIRRGGKDGNNA